jgi:hypothetical protein
VIIPSQSSYLHTGQHKYRINAYTDIHALSGIRTHDPSVRASEDSSCLRPRGHCDRLASERAKTVHASDRAATVTGGHYPSPCFYLKHRPLCIRKHSVSETGLCLRLQVKPTQLGSIDTASPFLGR